MATPTANFQVGRAWKLLVPSATADFLVSLPVQANVSLATSAADATLPADTIIGHLMVVGNAVSRTTFKSGPVFIRKTSGSETATVALDLF